MGRKDFSWIRLVVDVVEVRHGGDGNELAGVTGTASDGNEGVATIKFVEGVRDEAPYATSTSGYGDHAVDLDPVAVVQYEGADADFGWSWTV